MGYGPNETVGKAKIETTAGAEVTNPWGAQISDERRETRMVSPVFKVLIVNVLLALPRGCRLTVQ